MSIFSVTDDIVSKQVERTVIDEHSEFQQLWVRCCIHSSWNKEFRFYNGMLSNTTRYGVCNIGANYLPDKYVPGLRKLFFPKLRVDINMAGESLIGNPDDGWDDIDCAYLYLSDMPVFGGFKLDIRDELKLIRVSVCKDIDFIKIPQLGLLNCLPKFINCSNTEKTRLLIILDDDDINHGAYTEFGPYFRDMKKCLLEHYARINSTPSMFWISRYHTEFCNLLDRSFPKFRTVKIIVQNMVITIEHLNSNICAAIQKALNISSNDLSVFCDRYIINIRSI